MGELCCVKKKGRLFFCLNFRFTLQTIIRSERENDRNYRTMELQEKKRMKRMSKKPKEDKLQKEPKKDSILTRAKEHNCAVDTANWHNSCISAHKEHCQSSIDWENPRVITSMNNKSKSKLNYDLKIWAALKIHRNNCGPGRGLNEDLGAYVISPTWNVILHQMDNG